MTTPGGIQLRLSGSDNDGARIAKGAAALVETRDSIEVATEVTGRFNDHKAQGRRHFDSSQGGRVGLNRVVVRCLVLNEQNVAFAHAFVLKNGGQRVRDVTGRSSLKVGGDVDPSGSWRNADDTLLVVKACDDADNCRSVVIGRTTLRIHLSWDVRRLLRVRKVFMLH